MYGALGYIIEHLKLPESAQRDEASIIIKTMKSTRTDAL